MRTYKVKAYRIDKRKKRNDVWVEDPETFITVGGAKVPVANGQSKEEAGKAFVAEKAKEADRPSGPKNMFTEIAKANKQGIKTGELTSKYYKETGEDVGAMIYDPETENNYTADKQRFAEWVDKYCEAKSLRLSNTTFTPKEAKGVKLAIGQRMTALANDPSMSKEAYEQERQLAVKQADFINKNTKG